MLTPVYVVPIANEGRFSFENATVATQPLRCVTDEHGNICNCGFFAWDPKEKSLVKAEVDPKTRELDPNLMYAFAALDRSVAEEVYKRLSEMGEWANGTRVKPSPLEVSKLDLDLAV